jgi:hypothetical protein
LRRFALKTPRATHVGLFLSKKTDLSNRSATLKNFKIWMEYIANFFTLEVKLKKKKKKRKEKKKVKYLRVKCIFFLNDVTTFNIYTRG